MIDFISTIEQHPVLVTVIIFFLGGAGFLLKKLLFKDKISAPFIKAEGEIRAGGDISVGNEIVNKTEIDIKQK